MLKAKHLEAWLAATDASGEDNLTLTLDCVNGIAYLSHTKFVLGRRTSFRIDLTNGASATSWTGRMKFDEFDKAET